MTLSESDTRSKLIDPNLFAAGWAEALIEREYPYKRGRVRLLGDEPVRDSPQFVDYVLRYPGNGPMVAILEAKSEDREADSGLGQALGYATDLEVPFAYSSNGHGIVEHDRLTGHIEHLAAFPSPEQLAERIASAQPMRGATVVNSEGEEVANPLVEPVFVGKTGQRLRYYQEIAISEAIERMLTGHGRALLALATGTGKTFIASNLVWKLLRSGFTEKVLFLVDRVALLNQAYNDFSPFEDARGIVGGRKLPIHRDIHFATYQALYTETPSGRLFEEYPSDYFDLVIVDEAHRSGYGDWRAILDHFESAFHLGMTATPKRTDSIDTYEFFGAEDRDEDGIARPIYEYSLGQGIDDGFLATYQVIQIDTDIDTDGLHISDELARGADLFVPEEAEVRDIYQAAQFEREIVVEDRTQVLCQHLASKLRTWGANEKTIIYCVTVDHAELVRQLMQNLLGPETNKNRYAVRIVSEEKAAQETLDEFQQSESPEPVLATTVDLLTTGVNIPAAKNIVFMKPVGSPTVFKQIIGRGSRLDPATGKEFFRIVDYTDATRHFDAWDIPPSNGGEGPLEGTAIITGKVIDGATAEPIENAAVAVIAGTHQRLQVRTDDQGAFEVGDLPEIPVSILAGASGYSRRRSRLQPGPDPLSVTIELHRVTEGIERLKISGVAVTVTDETVLTLDSDGSQLTIDEYKDYVGEQVRTASGDVVTLAELWRDPAKREKLRQHLREHNVEPQVLSLVLDRSDADEFDLLASLGYGTRLRTREERARELEQLDVEFLASFTHDQRSVVTRLLDKYRLGGVEEIASASVFQVPPFIQEFGGVEGLAQMFGGAEAVGQLLRDIQVHLYPVEDSAA